MKFLVTWEYLDSEDDWCSHAETFNSFEEALLDTKLVDTLYILHEISTKGDDSCYKNLLITPTNFSLDVTELVKCPQYAQYCIERKIKYDKEAERTKLLKLQEEAEKEDRERTQLKELKAKYQVDI